MNLDALFEWLTDGARDVKNAAQLLTRVVEGLVGAGLPIHRASLVEPTWHPTLVGRAVYWADDAPLKLDTMTVTSGTSREANARLSGATLSPIVYVVMTRQEIHARLPTSDALFQQFTLVRELGERGFTEYLAMPLFLRDEGVHLLSFATRAPGGFTTEQLALLRRLGPSVGRVTDTMAQTDMLRVLLATYLGPKTATRVLSGKIRRGDVEEIRAVIWFSDMRGFTKASSTRTPQQMIDVLNDLFDTQVTAIAAEGGEVLKFIGDGLLAIFPCDDEPATRDRCRAALRAAHAVQEALRARQAGPDALPLDVGVALHVGEVAYGNIGAAERLDFTTIGAAVNLSARLEGIASQLGRSVVVSESFARAFGEPLAELGEFALKGIADPQKVYAPT